MSYTVVVGGAGFIGSHLVEALLKRGDEVTVVDDLSTGRLENIPKEAEFICESIITSGFLEDWLTGVDTVFHLAAIASVPRSLEEPLFTFEVNVRGMMNVLEAAVKCSVKKVVLASSCAVYGNGSPIQKEENIPSPLSPYALTKSIGEQCCRMYSDLYSLPTVCLRYFNVYGKGQPADSQYALVIPKFIDCAKSGLSLPIYGDGSQTRDFVNVDDVVAATIFAAESDMSGVYNVGSGIRTSVDQLARMIIKITGSKSALQYCEPRKGDAPHALADISKIKQAGFTPKWTLEEGLRQLIS